MKKKKIEVKILRILHDDLLERNSIKLHDLFREVCDGLPSPADNSLVDVEELNKHQLGRDLLSYMHEDNFVYVDVDE